MTAYYPGAIKNDYTTKIDFSDTVIAVHVNSLQEEVTAVESNLGTNIRVSSGWVGTFTKATSTWGSLKDRIANIEYGLAKALPDGGSTGQVLTKQSGTNYDVAWKTPTESLNAFLLMGA